MIVPWPHTAPGMHHKVRAHNEETEDAEQEERGAPKNPVVEKHDILYTKWGIEANYECVFFLF